MSFIKYLKNLLYLLLFKRKAIEFIMEDKHSNLYAFLSLGIILFLGSILFSIPLFGIILFLTTIVAVFIILMNYLIAKLFKAEESSYINLLGTITFIASISTLALMFLVLFFSIIMEEEIIGLSVKLIGLFVIPLLLIFWLYYVEFRTIKSIYDNKAFSIFIISKVILFIFLGITYKIWLVLFFVGIVGFT